MCFRSKVKHCIAIHRYGYWAVRCMMIKEGAAMEDIAEVLAMRLRILGED